MVLPFRYLPATLKANEGRMIKTSAMSSFMSVICGAETFWLASGNVRTNSSPKMPKASDTQMNTLVAIFCMSLVYQQKYSGSYGVAHLCRIYISPYLHKPQTSSTCCSVEVIWRVLASDNKQYAEQPVCRDPRYRIERGHNCIAVKRQQSQCEPECVELVGELCL